MKRRLLVLVAVLTLAVGVLVGARPAAAHNYDAYSLWYCAWSRPSGSYTVVHSQPVYLDPEWVRYWCGGVVGQVAFQWWVWRHLPDETMVSPGPYQDCRYYTCHEPGT